MSNQETQQLKRQYGPYICYRIIGMGENNIVYRARHEKTGNKFALRALHLPSDEKRSQAIKECLEELETIKNIESPYTVPILDFGATESTLYIVMRDMRGQTLMHRQKAFPDSLASLGEIAIVIDRLCLALDDIHERGMVHGEIEPRNILFNEKGLAYLGDIGLSRLSKIVYRLGASNSFAMSKYSAPEVWNGERPSPASDQYTLGCIVYEMITGKPPFQGKSVFDLMKKHQEHIIELPHYHRENVPVGLTMPLLRILAKQATQRYPTAYQFAQEFADTIAGFEGEVTDYFSKPVT